MKGNLRRIEDTLNQLTQKQNAGAASSQAAPPSPAISTSSVSFEVQKRTQTKPISPAVEAALPVAPSFVQPISIPSTEPKSLNLPKLKTPTFTSHRNGANPALAVNLLHEIQIVAESWQTELTDLVRQIQDLYLEGPIVDGWLESASEPKSSSSVLRHAEVDRLMEYIEELAAQQNQKNTFENPHPGYRLCGLNADGQLWSCPCPPEQVPSVSLAIARHQKLRQLLTRKQYLETRLNQLSESLVVLHGQIKES